MIRQTEARYRLTWPAGTSVARIHVTHSDMHTKFEWWLDGLGILLPYWTYSFTAPRAPGAGKIDLDIPGRAQGQGIARFLWGTALALAPPVPIYGHASTSLAYHPRADNIARRDALWRDLLGVGTDPESTARRDDKGGEHFFGRLRTPFHPDRCPALTIKPLGERATRLHG